MSALITRLLGLSKKEMLWGVDLLDAVLETQWGGRTGFASLGKGLKNILILNSVFN